MIIVDTEMPGSCGKCKLRTWNVMEDDFCCLTENKINTYDGSKRDDCPLIEVKE